MAMIRRTFGRVNSDALAADKVKSVANSAKVAVNFMDEFGLEQCRQATRNTLLQLKIKLVAATFFDRRRQPRSQ